jgi:hypothetical protein
MRDQGPWVAAVRRRDEEVGIKRREAREGHLIGRRRLPAGAGAPLRNVRPRARRRQRHESGQRAEDESKSVHALSPDARMAGERQG